jgi:hypothetical protein
MLSAVAVPAISESAFITPRLPLVCRRKAGFDKGIGIQTMRRKSVDIDEFVCTAEIISGFPQE